MTRAASRQIFRREAFPISTIISTFHLTRAKDSTHHSVSSPRCYVRDDTTCRRHPITTTHRTIEPLSDEFPNFTMAGGGSMMTWGHIIWIFFPIPLVCLILLSLPNYRKVEQWGTNLVDKIFFTRVSVGLVYIRLVHVFIGASLLVFGVACRSIHLGFSSAHVPCSG